MIETTAVTAVLAVLSPILTMFFSYTIYKRNARTDIEVSASKDAQLMSEVGYIKSGIDDLKRRQEKSDEQHLEVITRLTAVEASARQAHKRLDGLEDKIKN